MEFVAGALVYANLCAMAWYGKIDAKFYQLVTWFAMFVIAADKLELVGEFWMPK